MYFQPPPGGPIAATKKLNLRRTWVSHASYMTVIFIFLEAHIHLKKNAILFHIILFHIIILFLHYI